MSRFSRVLQRTVGAMDVISPQLSFDLGSRTTRIWLGTKLIWQQPTCLAWQPSTQTVWAIGAAAAKLVGKSPPGVEVYWPFQEGVVADLVVTEQYLRAVLHELSQSGQARAPWRWLWPHVVVAVPSSSSPVERQQLGHVLEQVGVGSFRLITKAQALAAALAKTRQLSDEPTCLVDIGAQTVELMVLTGAEPIVATTLTATTGDSFTAVIQKHLKDEYDCSVGWLMAEKLKAQLAAVPSARHSGEDRKVVIRGTQFSNQALTSVKVSSALLGQALEPVVADLVHSLRVGLSWAPPEVVSHSFERGVILLGGGSRLIGLPEKLTEMWQTEVTRLAQPETSVGEGVVWWAQHN